MKSSNKIVLLLLMIAIALPVCAQKMVLRKSSKAIKPRIHPYEQLLSGRINRSAAKDATQRNNRLLVIMVDFQEETTDNPLTTGNGKFELVPNPEYKTTLSSPPHNQEYYTANLEALRYYYLAVSRGSFDLQYDIYPQNKIAYTLPQPMGYYNPPGSSGELFLSRMEEYFKSAFEIADSTDAEINFAQYSHFMIIHAGSDWQHDVKSDTPSDLPSFFINLADGKEALVDNGAVRIHHACNVPSTISQDFDSDVENGTTYYTGYGALNGVLAHEFGHSLGFVDLYNTYNFNPMVGQFDIMDSGGAGVSMLGTDAANEYVLVEGAQPCLPGAFSTLLAFGDSFTARGLVKDVSQLELYRDLSLSASSKMQTIGGVIPTIFKIPLNNKEYILVENRSIDADGDGGTAVHDTLNLRVVLYPTGLDDPNNAPTYEYDYMLPSFITDSGVAGGGIIVWHVDDEVIYDKGITNSQGDFVNNLANNTVNGRYSRRGVYVIEADALEDIGNNYSWYWTGTPYEYFHKYKPNLGPSGLFVSWSNELWRPELTAASVPALKDFYGKPSFYGLSKISQPSDVMTFQISAGMFDNVVNLGESDTSAYVLPIINSNLAPLHLPVLVNGDLHFYTLDPLNGVNDWVELYDPLGINLTGIDFEPVTGDVNGDGYQELYIAQGNSLKVIQISNDFPEVQTIETDNASQKFSSAPLVAFGHFYCVVDKKPYTFIPAVSSQLQSINLPTGIAQLAATDQSLVLLLDRQLLLVNPDNNDIAQSYDLPEVCSRYTPVILKNSTNGQYSYYVVSDIGNIYLCEQNRVRRIFTNTLPGQLPTNLAISDWEDYSPCLFFALADHFYVMKADGTLLPGYPQYLEGYTFQPYSQIMIQSNEIASGYTPTHIAFLRLTSGGRLAVDSKLAVDVSYSIINMDSRRYDFAVWNDISSIRSWSFVDNQGNVVVADVTNLTADPFTWKGFRNGNNGMIALATVEPDLSDNKFDAYAFPSPVRSNLLRIRIENSVGANKLRIYNIAGNLVSQQNYSNAAAELTDLQIDVSGYSPGVYIGVVEQDKHQKQFKFAIEK